MGGGLGGCDKQVVLAYDPAANAWTNMRPEPYARPLLARDGIGGLNAGAAYDPRGNRWQRLATPPVPGRAAPLAAWTGDRAIFLGGTNLGDRLRMDQGNITAITEQGAAWRPR